MKIYYSVEDFARLENAVVTSGTFDGVHLGHRKILQRLNEIALRTGGESVVITFWPHPRFILRPDDQSLKLLNTFEEKAELLRAQGIQHLLRIPFTKEFSQITSAEFISGILVEKIGTRKLVIGYDHRFGKNREGSFDELRKNGPNYGFEVEEIPAQDVDHVTVSSSRVREALENGDVTNATLLLGQPYSISGLVIKCDQIGRTLGFPTANIDVDSHFKLIPQDGIYAVTVELDNRTYKGMLYIGNRPTIDGKSQVIEVNIFDFTQDIYGQSLKINLIKYLRGDRKLPDLDALREQLKLDRDASLEALKQFTTA